MNTRVLQLVKRERVRYMPQAALTSPNQAAFTTCLLGTIRLYPTGQSAQSGYRQALTTTAAHLFTCVTATSVAVLFFRGYPIHPSQIRDVSSSSSRKMAGRTLARDTRRLGSATGDTEKRDGQ